MTATADLTTRLQSAVNQISHWRAEALRIRGLAASASVDKPSDLNTLVDLEETAGAIYKDISAFQATLLEVSTASPEAAGELAEVGDALRLVLLEITELGTEMYSKRSGLTS